MKIQKNYVILEELIPNSRAFKKSDLQKAREALEKAKLIPRAVRKALSTECEFWREMQKAKEMQDVKPKEREDGLITALEGQRLFGISQFTINNKRLAGNLPFVQEGRKFFYKPEDIQNIECRKYNTQKF